VSSKKNSIPRSLLNLLMTPALGILNVKVRLPHPPPVVSKAAHFPLFHFALIPWPYSYSLIFPHIPSRGFPITHTESFFPDIYSVYLSYVPPHCFIFSSKSPELAGHRDHAYSDALIWYILLSDSSWWFCLLAFVFL